jgi:hypothetical protein
MLARQVKAALNSVAPKPGVGDAAAGGPAAAYCTCSASCCYGYVRAFIW